MRKTKTTASNCRCRLLISSGVILAMAVFVGLSFFTQPSGAQTPSCPPALQNLVSWWGGEMNTGDTTGQNHGTPVGTVSYTQGQVGQAFSFNGNGYVQVPDSTTLEPSRITVEAWVRHPGSPGQNRYVLSKGGNGIASYAIWTSEGGLRFYISDNFRHSYVSSDAGLSVWDGAWHHVVGTFDGAAVSLYVDGAQVGDCAPVPPGTTIGYDLPPASADLPTTGNVHIGSLPDIGNTHFGFIGDVDEVKVYNSSCGNCGPSPTPTPPADGDGDGIADASDNCPSVANADQLDTDADGTGDACDTDDDNDGVTDGADQCSGTLSGTQVNAAGCPDADGDGVADMNDNCPATANPDQLDADNDGRGDACDTCPAGDADSDGVCDGADNCPNTPNPDQANHDSDAEGDTCDTDDDGDGFSDAAELAAGSDPLNAASTPEVCDGADNDLDGTTDEGAPDTDNDGQPDCTDTDDDGDGQTDADELACGSNPTAASSKSSDTDNDGRPDCIDTDDDGDGREDGSDNCPLTANPNQEDNDGDGVGDTCDVDDDGDLVLDAIDNCPLISNPGQSDLDRDGTGDACDSDDDNDGVADEQDLCPGTPPGTIVNASGCPIVTNVPSSAQQCKNDGWRRLVRRNGSSFKTQGDCVQFVNTGK
jgi:hypothetical protein